MKKILIPCFLLTISLFASGQLGGDGSSGNPFYGTISTNVQWSVGNPDFGSTVYIGITTNPDITVTTGGHLTIGPGITVILTQLTSDLIITGSGQLTADGTGSNPVLFTKDPAIDHWGHITFEAPGSATPITGTGTFRHCKFEYGYTEGNLPDPNAAGGAIQVNAQDVLIENCFFSNNYARFGGAVAVNVGRNTIIRNSFFKSNYAIECAGALLLSLSSAATVENCIFDNNNCAGSSQTYYGGGAVWSDQNSSRIISCTFARNNSARAGDALYTNSSPGTIIVNSIFWGSNDQYANNSSSYSITNCAFESVKPASSVNSIILNSVNTTADGPNFVATDGSDWSIKFISPCRDAGVNSYTGGVTIPTSDYRGYPTIFNKDMGAYEVRYSRWTGGNGDSWSLSSNWAQNVDPSNGTGDVIIPAAAIRYPVNSSNPAFTIGAGKQMIMEPGSKVTLSSITNNGKLRLRSDATGISSLILNSYSGNTADAELFLTGGPVPDGFRWHLISSPYTTSDISPIISVTSDLAQWIETWDRMSLDEGWIAFDGYIYPDGALGGPQFDNFVSGKGYTCFYESDWTYTLNGMLNTSDKNVSITCSNTGDLAFLYGHNLIGNPFSSGLNWDAIIAGPTYPANTSKALHYRKDGTHVYYVNGVGSEPGVNGIIPPMQGFFVKTYAPSGVINLSAGARVHDNIPSRYKGGEPVIPLTRLKISTGDYSDYTTVRFDYNARNGLDMDFDAIKDFFSSVRPGIYTVSEGSKFVINGLPFPEHSTDIPVELKLISSGNHTITATEINGLENYMVSLVDNETGNIMNLRTNPTIPFSSASGLITGRFVLRVTEVTTDIDYPEIPTGKKFIIYNSNGLINIQTNCDEWNNKTGSVKLLDLNGRIISILENAELLQSSIIGLPAPQAGGLYFIEIRSGLKKFVGKVIVQ